MQSGTEVMDLVGVVESFIREHGLNVEHQTVERLAKSDQRLSYITSDRDAHRIRAAYAFLLAIRDSQKMSWQDRDYSEHPTDAHAALDVAIRRAEEQLAGLREAKQQLTSWEAGAI